MKKEEKPVMQGLKIEPRSTFLLKIEKNKNITEKTIMRKNLILKAKN